MWIFALGDACDLCHEGETDAILYDQKLATSMLTIIRTVLSDFRCSLVPSLSSYSPMLRRGTAKGSIQLPVSVERIVHWPILEVDGIDR